MSFLFDVMVDVLLIIEVVFSNIMDISCLDFGICDGQVIVIVSYSDGFFGDFIFIWVLGEFINGGIIFIVVQFCVGI